MSIANEMQKIIEEIPRLQTAKANIKSAIEQKGVTVGNGTIDTYAEKIGEISAGGGIELDRYLKTATFTSLNMFGTKEAVLNFYSIVESLFNLFNISSTENINTTVEHLTINCPTLVKTIQQMLFASNNNYADTTLKKVTFNVDTQNCTNFRNAFGGMRALEVIDGFPLNFSSNTQANIGVFSQNYALTTVRVVQGSIYHNLNIQHSSNLDTDTIQSIIDGLADLTGGTAQTLKLHANVGAKLTDEQKATITAKNWTLVY